MAGPAANASERDRALQAALGQVERAFGKGAIMRMGESDKVQVEAISTGSLSLDMALGVGGLPRGRITEIYGPESGGKTTLALHCVAETQRAGGLALYIDAEHALDTEYARALGVDVDRLYISQPSNGEEALEIADAIIRSGAVDIVVVDSVAALVPKAEIEGEMGDSFVGVSVPICPQHEVAPGERVLRGDRDPDVRDHAGTRHIRKDERLAGPDPHEICVAARAVVAGRASAARVHDPGYPG